MTLKVFHVEHKPCADMTDQALQMELEELEVLMNDRQLKFATAKLRGESNRDAWKGAGYSTTTDRGMDAGASKLVRSIRVSRYMLIRQEQDRRVARITPESMVTAMARLGQKAERNNDLNTARQCYAEAAKLLDFYPAAKSEVDIKDDRALAEALKGLDDDQKRQLFAARREQEESRVH